MPVKAIRSDLGRLGDERWARFLQRYFKTANGEYGEGDIFLGVHVPELRKLARKYAALAAEEIMRLLQSPIHEERALALLILVRSYAKGDEPVRARIYETYLRNTRYINNWDLVDVSAPHIVGAYLMDKSRDPLYELAESESLWERRISVIATAHFIKRDQFRDTLEVSKILLADKHDLIHKAVGWMLREVGKRDLACEEGFLRRHYKRMPRTMLRYAIEKFPEKKRRMYLKGEV